LFVWIGTLPKKPGNTALPAGVHLHTDLSIEIDGESIDIPQGLGLGGGINNSMHVHEADNVLHMHSWTQSPLRERDVTLGNFFKVWGKDFTRESLLGSVAESGKSITMTVNGVENFEFENYVMQDGDVIEIIYK